MGRTSDDATGDLFGGEGPPSRERDGRPRPDSPLADRVRPRTLEELLGQDEALGPGRPLRRAIEADELRSLILWGPPGSGKTTLAHVIRRMTRAHFEAMSAVLSGVKELREKKIADGSAVRAVRTFYENYERLGIGETALVEIALELCSELTP